MSLDRERIALIGRFDDERGLTRRLQNLGAEVTRELDAQITLVVVGHKAKAKLKKAERLGVPMKPVAILLTELDAELEQKKPARKPKPVGPTSKAELVRELAQLRFRPSVDAPHFDLRRRVLALCRDAQRNGLSFDGLDPVTVEPTELDGPSCLLLFWCDDDCASYVIPHDSISTGMLEDLRAINGLVFAGADDCDARQLGAAVRTLFALRGGDAGDFHLGWSIHLECWEDDPALGIQSADDLRPLANVLRPCFRDLGRHRITEVIAVSKEH